MFDLKVWQTPQPAFSSPVWFSHSLKKSALITNKSQKLLTVTHLLPMPLHAACCLPLFCEPHPRSLTEVFSLCTQSAVSVSSCFPLSPSLSLRERHSYPPFNDTFCACRAIAFSSVGTRCYLNGIKQMRWAEHQLTGHWSGCVISPFRCLLLYQRDWSFVH